jgi:hypothetical protein
MGGGAGARSATDGGGGGWNAREEGVEIAVARAD